MDDQDEWQKQIKDLELEGLPNRGFTAKHNPVEKQASTLNPQKTNPPKEKKEKKALKPISIKIPPSLVENLKGLAAQDNIGYQTYIKIVLSRHVSEERLKKKS